MSREQRQRRRVRGRIRRLLSWVALSTAIWIGWEAVRWPDVAALRHSDPDSTAFIDRYERGRAPGTPAAAWQPVPYERISGALKRAVLVAEDIGFFDHHGFAVEEIRLAVRQAWERREVPRGASTLTQQLAKNLWLSPSRNPFRKIKEAILTWQLERSLDKRRILALYLNVVEFGPGVYGAEAAARRYFGSSAARLTEEQAAELAAALPRPSSWHPGSASAGYRQHVARVRARMEKAAWLAKVI